MRIAALTMGLAVFLAGRARAQVKLIGLGQTPPPGQSAAPLNPSVSPSPLPQPSPASMAPAPSVVPIGAAPDPAVSAPAPTASAEAAASAAPAAPAPVDPLKEAADRWAAERMQKIAEQTNRLLAEWKRASDPAATSALSDFQAMIGTLSNLDRALAGQSQPLHEINVSIAKAILEVQRQKAQARVADMKTAQSLAARAGSLTLQDLPGLSALLNRVRPARAPEKPMKILFVCSGNTDRSPMAEYIFKHLQKLKNVAGIEAVSRGATAMPDQPASPETQRVLREIGIDASAHKTMPLTQADVADADLVLTMTQGHVLNIVVRAPNALDKVMLLNEYAGVGPTDIIDPVVGGLDDMAVYNPEFIIDPEAYRKTAQHIGSVILPTLSQEQVLLTLRAREAELRAQYAALPPAKGALALPAPVPSPKTGADPGVTGLAAELYRSLIRDSGLEVRLREAVRALDEFLKDAAPAVRELDEKAQPKI